MRLGQLAEDKLGGAGDAGVALARAADAFERASHGPEPRPALAALERVLARSSKWPQLAGVLRRQADAAEDDVQTAEYLYREGDLQEVTLRDVAAAIAAYREVLRLVPSHPRSRGALERLLAPNALATTGTQRTEIVDILEPLFEHDGDAARLVAVLEARLTLIEDALDRAQLLQRIAELAEGDLRDGKRALDAALRWLAADPASHQALAEVDRLAQKLSAPWQDVAARVRDVVASPATSRQAADVRVGLLVFQGRVLRERLNALDDAPPRPTAPRSRSSPTRCSPRSIR